MATSQISKNENRQKGNSSDTLLAIYILKILKKYSSPKKWISTGAVCEYLSKDYPFAVCNDNTGSQTKKVRRYLDTLSESYEGGCVRKKEGKSSREGFEWCYDASKDDLEVGETQSQETLTELNDLLETKVQILGGVQDEPVTPPAGSDSTDSTSSADSSSAGSKKKGCNASMAICGGVVAVLGLGAAMLLKKKRD